MYLLFSIFILYQQRYQYLYKYNRYNFISQEDIHPQDQVARMVDTETETMVAMVMEDIHLEMVAMSQLMEDTNIKYLSRCNNIYCAYYKKGIHGATFIITHRIVSVWNGRNSCIGNDNYFRRIEFLCRCLMYLIVLGYFQLNDDRNKKNHHSFNVENEYCNASFVSDVVSFLV